ncbi:hypothetical protein HYU23_02570 [Candidatus Woesearchaeota archaeon]|nr:hypothetical protein [Candidatus Woesearchaeota archaeon]
MKKGVSPLLAAVLLVALAVTMSAIVSNYVIKKTREFNPEQLAEQSIYCESVALGYTIQDSSKLAIYGQGENDPARGDPIKSKGVFLFGPITLVNRGSFSIHQLIISAPGLQSLTYPVFGKDNKITELKPGVDNKYTLSMQVNMDNTKLDKEIKIVPVIKDIEKNQFVKCSERQLVINYKQVCQEILKKDCECKGGGLQPNCQQ